MELIHDPENRGWNFETEDLKGFLLPEGDRHGVKTLVHKPSGVDVVHPRYDVLNLFMLFSRNHWMGTAREKERTVRQEGDQVIVHWEPTKDHKAELTAIYRFREPNAIDLTITVAPQWPYSAYELFLSSYFDPDLQPYVHVQGSPYADPPNQDQWIRLQVNNVFVGTGLVFPRDQHAARLSTDGRWERIWALYQWNPQRYYGLPMMLEADLERNLAAVHMGRREDTFAVITGYDSPNHDDPFKDQNPLYLSLFGKDMLPGQEYTARTRLLVTSLDEALARPAELYEAFLADG